ncbi:ly6/PLAUR domain-containing protein 6B-like [Macrosteles quadrilineatus]|uniref:ly6/PLAUR domain-containing protein 6B-like n=1 Tax=Macrosteles quadrilineatus TaxID=74068 RepID=UPI0023E26EC1|nr:ly6/PLAUR domain-containing protein 6B-like [Macrosteles quadrilineatus]XP_054268828.1 ly6/PLAUR domain-containing protein 6B-like [Macrosteles quadrilineatus]XP_054289913.1 ly6/PLAUR domain-containing protein 6B-like [Macrosteles quadrilineatus]
MVNGPFIRVIILASLFRHSSPASREVHPQENETDDDSDAGVTCYTCVNVSDNSMCNEFAIDHPCPKGENFCHTLHIMDSRGASVVVNKKCADSSECWPQGVGCVNIDSQTVCVSCCDEMYCNVTVPTNKTTATFSSTRKNKKKKQYTVLSNTRASCTTEQPSYLTMTLVYLVTSLKLCTL